MKQKQFVAEHHELWSQIQGMLNRRDPEGTEELPTLYRRLCQSLALAIQRGYSPALTEYLQTLVLNCHTHLYGTAVERPATLVYWLGHLLPQRVRQEWRLVLLTLIAFWGVAVSVGLLVWFQPQWAYSFIEPEQLHKIHTMYQPGVTSIGRGGSAGDVQMFGFYIWNNVSICFRTFAGGIFAGIPALFSITFNGAHLGVVAAWLTKDPATRHTFWSFVITHASFEITGLLLAGVSGMRMGLSLINPGRLSRRHSLYAASQSIFPVVIGAALLTVLAAFFEGFWSASPSIPMNVKYSIGSVCWLLVIGFFCFAGRSKP